MSKTYIQEKLVSGTNIKTINSQTILGEGNIEVGSGSTTTKQWVFKGEAIKYRTFELGDHKKLLVKVLAQGWMSFVDKPYWFVLDFDGISSYDTLFLLASKTATDNNVINMGLNASVQTGWVGVKTTDGSSSRQVHFSYHASDKAFDWEVSHNDITWIIEFEFLD